ncbi:MAG: hypothetical protein LDL31_01000 [Prosthecobacter sp.]|jgi:hypothetical protein|nr:hypothetical protein [Prosthecobacter sp.]
MKNLFLFSLACLVLCSCSSGFRREWKSALSQGPSTGVTGAWEGTWKSDVNGHHGRLRCVVGPAINAQGDHTFHYHATWARIFSGAYAAQHRVVTGKNSSTFSGQHDMPDWAGGRYTYSGTVKGDDFSACYQCAKDKGTFQMRRVR